MRSTVLLLLSGLALACAQSVPSLADPVATARPTPRDPYADHIAEAAQRFELPAAWIKAVLRAESNGDPRAVSPKGAIGLMQLLPSTAREVARRLRVRVEDATLLDSDVNIRLGTAYLGRLRDRLGGHLIEPGLFFRRNRLLDFLVAEQLFSRFLDKTEQSHFRSPLIFNATGRCAGNTT